MRKMRGTLAAVLLVGVTAVPARAAQMDPAVPPTATGPLVESNASYEGEHCTKRSFDEAVVSLTCRFFYRYDSTKEMDPENDHGMWWFQSRFKTRPGWCLVRAKTSIALELDDSTITGSSEKRRKIEEGTATISNKLAGDASSNSSAASLKKSFVVRKGLFVSHFREDTSVMKLRWEGGSTPKSIGLAGGVEGYWPTAGAPPPFTLSGGPSFTTC